MWIHASFLVAQAVVDPENIPSAVGFLTLAQFAGITIALAIANAVFLNDSETTIMRILPNVPHDEILAAIEGASYGFFKNLPKDLQARVIGALVDILAKAYILVITVSALVIVLSLFMKQEKLFVLQM